MSESFSFFTTHLALLSGITGLFFFKKLPNNKAKSILIFIWIAFITDVFGLHFTKWTGYVNYPIYNFYILISFIYYIILLCLLLTQPKNQKIAAFSLLSFILFYFFNLIFIQKNLASPFTYVFGFGVVLILLLSCLYLVEIFNSVRILNFKKSIYFWFILGILVFHIPFLPYMLAIRFLLIVNSSNIFSVVLFVLNLLMHICFIIGFLCSEKKYNY